MPHEEPGLLGVINAINLDRRPDKLERLRAENAHLPDIVRIAAADGALLDRASLVAAGYLTEGNSYSPSAIGHAMSHIRLWQEGLKTGHALTVVEDDIVLHRDFRDRAEKLLAALNDWHFVAWGWNQDWPMIMQAAPGLPPLGMMGRMDIGSYDTTSFQQAAFTPRAHKLFLAAGTPAYTISPSGMAYFLEKCLPLASLLAPGPFEAKQGWHNTALDVELSRHYEKARAFVCFPPLGFTVNDAAQSDIEKT